MNEKPIALVTGASRGIGKAVAQALSAEGYFVVGTATSQSGADNISAYLAQNGHGTVMQLSDPSAIEDSYAALKSSYGAPAVLVNNAGIVLDQLAIRTTTDAFDEVLNVNVRGTFVVSKLAAKDMMRARTGAIVNIGSVTGSMGNAGQVAYTASKAAMGGMTRTLAKELGVRNIRVNCIEPGFVATDMTEQLSDELKTMATATIPLGRFAQPEEIASVVVFLASDKAQYITGETLAVNGGLYMK